MNREEALSLLNWANGLNPGPWAEHSLGVARAAEKIAEACGMDSEHAWLCGALHDIGRYEGVYGMRHIFAGYRLLTEKGEPALARICLTHSFSYPDPEAYVGPHDGTDADMALLRDVLQTPMDDYDRLIQLCDALSWGSGVCLMEKRMMDVFRRHGCAPLLSEKINATFAVFEDFQNRMGHSLYDLFPEAAANTFQYRKTVTK